MSLGCSHELFRLKPTSSVDGQRPITLKTEIISALLLSWPESPEQVAAFSEIGGRNQSESVAAFNRIRWSQSAEYAPASEVCFSF